MEGTVRPAVSVRVIVGCATDGYAVTGGSGNGCVVVMLGRATIVVVVAGVCVGLRDTRVLRLARNISGGISSTSNSCVPSSVNLSGRG